MVAETRWNVLGALNSKYIYGRLPLLHAIVLLIEMGIVARIASKFNSYYESKPLLTIMITNAILGGIADTTAQTITAFRMRSAARALEERAKDQFISLEITTPADKNDNTTSTSDAPTTAPSPLPSFEYVPNVRSQPPPFDFERLTRFMAYGFIMSPVQFQWFGMLSRAFPVASGAGLTPVLKRTACDQLIFAPFGLTCFYTFMTVAEGGGWHAISKKFQDIYLPTLKANWMVWPVVQIINFRFMPLQFQIPFVSSIGILWTAYLSLTNSAEDKAIDDE